MSWLKDNITPVLALLLVGGSFFLFGLFSIGKIDQQNRDIVLYVLGVLSGYAGAVVTYYFGSSDGSSKKNDIIKGLKDGSGDSAVG